MFNKIKNNQGFTILELMVAVGVMLAVFSAIGGFINRIVPDYMLVSSMNEESQYARAATQLLAREINKSGAGIGKTFFLFRENKIPYIKDNGDLIAPVMILEDNNNNPIKFLNAEKAQMVSGKRIWIATGQEPKIISSIKDESNKHNVQFNEVIEQTGKIYSTNGDRLLVYQTATRTISYNLRITQDAVHITPSGSATIVTDKNAPTMLALPGTKQQITSLNFVGNRPRRINNDSMGNVFNDVYTINLVMDAKITADRSYKYSTTLEASVSPLTIRSRKTQWHGPPQIKEDI